MLYFFLIGTELSHEPKPESRDESEEANLQDVALRKMVLEVIFGQNNEPNIETESIISTSDSDVSKNCNSPETSISSRPVRNRVKPVNKDFIYDLNEFTDGPRASSQNSNRSLCQYDKNLSRSLEELSTNKNKKIDKKPGLKCNMPYPLDLNNTKNIDLNLQNDGNNEECTNTSVECLESNLSPFATEFVNIQQDNEVWIIDDE